MSSLAQPFARPWRRYLRFSVRALVVLVVVIGAWLGWIVRNARIQHDAVAAIRHEHGIVFYDCDWKDGTRVRRSAHPRHLKWLENQFGIDYFSNVVYVDFRDGSSDAKLALVARLYRIEELLFDPRIYNQRNSSLTDSGLAHLEGHTRLKELDLGDTDITDGGLVHLRGLTGLQKLDLSATNITDAGLVYVGRLIALRELDLSDTEISDAGVAHLEGLTGLEHLNLESTGISNTGVLGLKRLAKLQSLDVYRTKVDDFGAQELRRAIRQLKIRYTAIIAR